MANRLNCPNCGGYAANHPEDGCVLAALIQVIRERQSMSEAKLRKIHAGTVVDVLWDDLGRIIDKLEDGTYSP